MVSQGTAEAGTTKNYVSAFVLGAFAFSSSSEAFDLLRT